jgi:hypothetical protein
MEKVDMMDIYIPIFGDSMGIISPYVGGGHSGQFALLIYTEKVKGREYL